MRLMDIISPGGEEDGFLLIIEPCAFRLSRDRDTLLADPIYFAAWELLLLKKYLIFLLRNVSLCNEHLLSKLVPL